MTVNLQRILVYLDGKLQAILDATFGKCLLVKGSGTSATGLLYHVDFDEDMDDDGKASLKHSFFDKRQIIEMLMTALVRDHIASETGEDEPRYKVDILFS